MVEERAIDIGIAGAAGRMGKMLISEVISRQDVALVGAYEKRGHQQLGIDAGIVCGTGECGIPLTDDIENFFNQSQVVIDFTHGSTAALHAECAASVGSALVIGSTAIEEPDKKRIAKAGQSVAIVMAPNMSWGVNVLFELVRVAAQLLGDSHDSEIMELHHRHKKDAPSGTSLKLGEIISAAQNKEHQPLIERDGVRPSQGVGYGLLRGGGAVGEHHVFFIGEDDRIEITHRASHRCIYAQGAVNAAVWAVQQKAGLYDMKDVIGIQ